MFTRRAVLSSAGVAALLAPAVTVAAPSETMWCCMATVYPERHQSHHGLMFELPEGLFFVEHASLYTGRFTSVKDGVARFIDEDAETISRGIEFEVPRSFLDAALALHRAQAELERQEASIWEIIRKANGISAL